MKTAFIHVNYNNSNLTINCIRSIIDNDSDSDIIIVDNNSDLSEKEKLTIWKQENDSVQNKVTLIFETNNLGYFGALNVGLEYLKININKYDYVIIGNNDLVFNEIFFKKLKQVQLEDNIFLISPNIVKKNGIHQNPYSINGTSKIRLFFYYIYYSNYTIAKIILLITRILKVAKSEQNRKGFDKTQIIYAGHGSCYILTRTFFKNNFSLVDNSFLMGEEFILAKQIRDTNGKIIYIADLIVTHDEHSSMKNIPSKVVYGYKQAAFKLIKDIY